ncbi:mannitol dehydrogenase family protein [Burkholderia gladioli]|uniref:mannitol dehydrogenase family protein n=1 Tax=Burkholderia gladioli TaxID=28095 RepID=UPI00136497F1|nr:mannitol dehydrogenase family protein [Burkholderia gladioli]KAF1059155.1 Polyol:NADP oxidoreductase [Burkholderia gladioli]WAG23279.1 mannitol dehydrogenase family protein [Burkholderia gladioli]
MATLLSQASLGALPADTRRPAYARDRLQPGIVHLGLGAFHRAHQALYTEALLEAGDLRWGIVGVHLRERRMAELIRQQDLLYSVTESDGETTRSRVAGALVGALHAPSALPAVLDAITDPRVSIVSLTVTEKGYSIALASGDLDLDDADIRHDLLTPDTPRTTLGVLAAGIRRRAADAPLSVVCCDNMAGNGDRLRKLLMQYARGFDASLASRIGDTIAFPNTMVDRIVPAATPVSLAAAEARLGLRDEAAIACEPFTQWVIEDRFSGPRPAWEEAGALLTGDVRPYEAMKLRLLNGSHSAIAYLGQLRGRATVAEAMADPAIGTFVQALMREDLLATVTVPRGFDVQAYCDELLARFRNPTLAHQTRQIAMDGTQKVPVRWLPALRESLAAGIERPHLERALAAWLHYLATARGETGETLAISDPGAAALTGRLRAADTPLDAAQAALGHHGVFGAAPWPADFVARLARHLAGLRERGTEALLARSAER